MTKIQGIVVPQYAYSQNALSLLATDGKLWPLIWTAKTEQLRNFLWDQVNVVGTIKNKNGDNFLEVVYFDTSEGFQNTRIASTACSATTYFKQSG